MCWQSHSCRSSRGGCESSSPVFPHPTREAVCLSVLKKLTNTPFWRPSMASTTSRGSWREVSNTSRVLTLTTPCNHPRHHLRGHVHGSKPNTAPSFATCIVYVQHMLCVKGAIPQHPLCTLAHIRQVIHWIGTHITATAASVTEVPL
jgi:hypothetical protein